MDAIIPITRNKYGEDAVSGRLLHGFLESRQEFTNWIKARISKYGFVDRQDFLIDLSESTGGRKAADYVLSLEMAKELAMLEGNEKGRQARRYFIECEKRLRQTLSPPELSRKALALLVIAAEEEKERLQIELQHAEKTLSSLHHVRKTYTATEIAKEIGFRSAMEMNEILSQRRIQYKQNGTWVLYSDYASKGYTELKQEVLDSGRIVYHRKFTQAGREFVLSLFESNPVV